MKNTSKFIGLAIIAAISLTILSLTGCPPTLNTGGGTGNISVIFTGLTANGSLTATTTRLTLVFDKDIVGLSTGDIALDAGSTGAIKGSLLRIDTGIYELAVAGISEEGIINVAASKPGYNITGGPKMVTVYRYVSSTDIVAAFTGLMANGSDGTDGSPPATTTILTLVFDKDIVGLSEADITLDGGSTGATNGALTRIDTGKYELAVSNIKKSGSVTVAVYKDSYNITGGTKNVTVYLYEIIIKNHPASKEFTLAGWTSAVPAMKTLTVVIAEAGKYQYQWYKNTVFSATGGNAIDGATNASYTPDITTVGNYYYYVTVTLGITVTSNPVMIKIVEAITPAETEFTIGADRLNYVRGVGGTGAFMFRAGNGDASPDVDVKYINLLFGELGANILRVMVQDDYENYVDNVVQSRNNSMFYHDARKNFFAVIRKVNDYGGYVYATPWTAPTSMKTGETGGAGELVGGTLTETGPNYVDYAEYLRDFLKWLNANNAPIFALGILNEPDFGGIANYEGMGMSPQVTRDWFRTVGNFTTQKVRNSAGAGPSSSVFEEGIIPGFGGGGPTHHVLVMSGEPVMNFAVYMDPQLNDNVSNNKIELMGRHYYGDTSRYTKVAGASLTIWKDRPQLSYEGPHEAASLAMSPQMYAPGSKPGNVKREIWQTEHAFIFWQNETTPPASNPQNYWNSVFALMNDIDWCLRVNGESVFDWWYSQSFSGLVTSYQASGFPPYTITSRGRAFAHYARYVNETWLLPIERTRGTINFNTTSTSFNAGATDPKISAFEDVNGKFISVVMFTPSYSTAGTNGGTINSGFGHGGTYGNDDPTRGSYNVGRIAVILPEGFVASSASAIRSYGNGNATSEDEYWTAANPVPVSKPRYWIDEPVFLSADGKSVEVTLPAGNIISIMIRGEWTGAQAAGRHFEERVRPYTVK